MNASAPDLERKTLDLAVVADHTVTDQDGSAGALPECWSPAAQPDDHVEIIGTPAPPCTAEGGGDARAELIEVGTDGVVRARMNRNALSDAEPFAVVSEPIGYGWNDPARVGFGGHRR